MNSEAAEVAAPWRQVTLNGQTYETDDRVQSARDLLTLGGFMPPSEHQLILVRHNRTRLIGLDDKVDLKDEAGGVFRAFEGDRTFSWTLDEIGQVWGTETLQVDELTALFDIPVDKELVLERDDRPDVVLRPGGVIAFDGRGVEDIVTRQVKPGVLLVTVFTTAGVFPAQGAVRARPDELVSVVLTRAARALGLIDTDTWVLAVDGREVNAGLTFAQNGLSGTVELDWAPREGGGGDA